jgi:hypothetical protein
MHHHHPIEQKVKKGESLSAQTFSLCFLTANMCAAVFCTPPPKMDWNLWNQGTKWIFPPFKLFVKYSIIVARKLINRITHPMETPLDLIISLFTSIYMFAFSFFHLH